MPSSNLFPLELPALYLDHIMKMKYRRLLTVPIDDFFFLISRQLKQSD